MTGLNPFQRGVLSKPVGTLDANELAHGAALPNSGYSPKNFIDFPDFARLSAMSRIACWRYLNCRLARTIKKSRFRRDVGWNALGRTQRW